MFEAYFRHSLKASDVPPEMGHRVTARKFAAQLNELDLSFLLPSAASALKRALKRE